MFSGARFRSACVASFAKLTPVTLLANGKLRLARRLHSITLRRLFFARNWMLKGPEIRSPRAIFFAIVLILRKVSMFTRCGGSTIVASPECTPAFSMCSPMA